MSSNRTIDLIKSNDLFKDLDLASHDIGFDSKNFLEFKEGDLIYSSGETSDFIYLIVSGEVKLKLNSVKRLFFRSPNEFFGETEAVQKEPRSSSALANSDCLVYKMDEKLFSKLKCESNLFNKNLEDTVIQQQNINVVPSTTEPIKKIAELDLQTETAKVDLNYIIDRAPKYQTSIDIDKINIKHYEQEPDLDVFIQQKYLDSDDKSLKSKLIGDSDDLANWIITEGELEEVADKKLQPAVADKLNIEKKDLSFTNPSQNFENQFGLNSADYKSISIPKPSENINKTAKDILEYLLYKTDSRVGAVYLYSQDSQMLEEVYQTNESIYKGKISIKDGITGVVARTKEIRFAVSFLNDSNYNQDVDRPNEFVGETLIIIPFVDDNKSLLGIVQIGSNQTTFTKDEERKIKEFAGESSKVLQQSFSLKTKKNNITSKPALSQVSKFIMQDVKAPLLTIKHYSSILSRFDLPEEVKRVISLLSSQTNSVIDLLQSSIDFSEKNTKTKLEVLSFNEVMDNNLTLLSDYVESRNVKLFKKLSEDAKVKIDKKKFYVACYYIARFACDLMKQGGNLYFSSQIEKIKVILNIKDGNKIASEDLLENVFDPGFTNNTDESVGLSLSIAKFIIESMNGSITLQNEEAGTSYLVSIPISS